MISSHRVLQQQSAHNTYPRFFIHRRLYVCDFPVLPPSITLTANQVRGMSTNQVRAQPISGAPPCGRLTSMRGPAGGLHGKSGPDV